MLKRATAAAMLTLAATVALGQNSAPTATPAQPAAAQPKPEIKALLVGDKAPALAVEKWLKGDAITGFEKGKIYVVEFWSPSSFGSTGNMPHLTELQKQYKDKAVTMIGVASKDPRTALDAVEKVVKDKADVIGYAIAWDSERKSFQAFVEAAGNQFLPVTFIVDASGVIAHIQSGDDKQLDKPLGEIVGGTYDLKAAAEKSRKDAETRAARAKDEAARAAAGKVISSYQAKDWAGVLAAYDAVPDKIKPRVAPFRFEALLMGTKDTDKAYAFGKEIVDGPVAKDSEGLNQVAWAIVNPENKVEKKDLDLAMKAATKADELTGGKKAAIIDTVARVYFCKGDVAKAIELEKKAIASIVPSDQPGTKEELEKALKEYEAAGKK